MKKDVYKLLIVEDEDPLRLIYKEYFASRDEFIVYDAENGYKALDRIRQHPDIDFILLDLVLPRKDGLEVLRSVKKDPKTKNIIIYILTQLASDDVIKKGFELGADGYLIKDTLHPDDLANEILNAIEN